MAKIFNVNGACIPELHYMVDLTSRLQQVKAMIDAGEYFTINRARQYGKTTMLQELALYLKPDYIVVSLDFQTMSSSDFQSECSFVNGLAREIEKKIRRMKEIPSKIQQKFAVFSREMNPDTRMADIFECFPRSPVHSHFLDVFVRIERFPAFRSFAAQGEVESA